MIVYLDSMIVISLIEFASADDVPLVAVHEALDYVADNLPLVRAERDREAADVRARGLDRPLRS
jgi:hypothetical protein